MKRSSIILGLLILPFLSNAKGVSLFEQYKWEMLIGLIVLVGIVMIVALITILIGLKAIVKQRRAELGLQDESEIIPAQPGEENVGFWGRFWNRFNSAVPIAKEAEVATSHEYDGIRELDNQLPPWWLYGFYISIIFSVIYMLHYEVLGTGETQHEEYVAQMKEANEQVDAYLASMAEEEGPIEMELLTDATALAGGAQVFKTNCAQCHAQDGGGMQGLGPNLTDKYWKHGGDFESILKVVQVGISGTSMIPWETQLRPKQMQEVVSYVYSLEGTTPANPKEPEGELFEREAEERESVEAEDTKEPEVDTD